MVFKIYVNDGIELAPVGEAPDMVTAIGYAFNASAFVREAKVCVTNESGSADLFCMNVDEGGYIINACDTVGRSMTDFIRVSDHGEIADMVRDGMVMRGLRV